MPPQRLGKQRCVRGQRGQVKARCGLHLWRANPGSVRRSRGAPEAAGTYRERKCRGV